MKLTSPFRGLAATFSDAWKMHDFNYEIPQDVMQFNWEKECRANPSYTHCKIYEN